jgi:hypothetical protein
MSGGAGAPGGPVLRVGKGALGPVNRLLLGSSVQAPGHADGLVDDQGALVPDRLAPILRTHPSLLRYPGGTLSDGFHFPDSLGPLAARPPLLDLGGQKQPLLLGVAEFLTLCQQAGAAPLFTVNVFSAPVDEALAWVKYAGEAAAKGQPKAVYWEVGNEPYLASDLYAEGGKDTVSPAEFAARASVFLKEMRSADPSIKLSIPARADTMNGEAVVTKPGFLDVALSSITEPFDLLSVHDGYLPLDYSAKANPEELYLAAMASSVALGEALDGYRMRLDQAFPGRTVRFALTEYHPFLTSHLLGVVAQPGYTPQEFDAALALDQRANSVAGAIYVADALRMLSYRPDVELANSWSLAENYIFGALSGTGTLRTPALALEAVAEMLQGDLLPVQLDAPTLSTPSVGLVHAFPAVAAVTALASREGPTLRLLVIQKHPTDAISIQLSLEDAQVIGVKARSLTTPDPLSFSETTEVAWAPLPVTGASFAFPPHSLTRIDLELAP